MVTIKKLRIFITAIVFLLALGVLGGFSSSASAATLGQPLPQPEEGWKRYDDTHPAIKYSNSFYRDVRESHYKGGISYAKNKEYFEFKFHGTKLRLFSYSIDLEGYRPEFVNISIDGVVEQYTEKYPRNNTSLVYEKTGLKNTTHTVRVWIDSMSSTEALGLDAIDIDADGYLVSPDMEVLELVGEVTNDVNSLTWNSVKNATYNVKRATTAGGPYTTIANELTTNSYIDSDVEEGVTYYYVVTAVLNGAESENSNEVALTREGEEPAPQPEPTGNAKLTLHLVDNQIKEYEVILDEVDRFSNWFDKRMSGTGQAFYVFELKHNITPYKAVKEYMVFDKIVWYEVREY